MFRPEHPNPQCKRADWLNLNGTWQFLIDNGGSGRYRHFEKDTDFDRTIEVPFCPQSRLSGIGEIDFYRAVWYKRDFTLTDEQASGTVLLHFGAVDYHAFIYLNGEKVGEHVGGYVSFTVDLTGRAVSGENTLVVCAEDDERDPMIPSGKQMHYAYASAGCSYTRTTGIWQTVWLEFMPKTHIDSFRLYPDAENGTVRVDARLSGAGTLTAIAAYDGTVAGTAEKKSAGGFCSLELKVNDPHLWEVGKGGLYTLYLSYEKDRVESYFGLRSIRYENGKFYLNGRSVFQRLVLDQGFYPDGVYTAPSEDALIADITMSQAVGFNGARLHEKIFEPLFLYHADRLGYLIWGEYPNWGLDHTQNDALYVILPEWQAEIERDFNHPSIIGWCPFNETWDNHGRRQNDETLKNVYRVTKAMDPTRPCIDTSGGYHTPLCDVYDAHNYDQDPVSFRETHDKAVTEGTLYIPIVHGKHVEWDGKKPLFISEYGGIRWSDDKNGWGYGNAPKTEEEFKARFKGLADALLDNPKIMGLCYTQLYDVEQEQNGLYTYARQPKFKDMTFFRDALSRKAKIEEE